MLLFLTLLLKEVPFRSDPLPTTTSHPDEIAEEVIEFARSFGDQSLGDVHVVRV